MQGDSRITPGTWVPVGLAVSAITAFVVATWWLRGTLQEIAFEQRLTSDRIGRIESNVQTAMQDVVNVRDLRLWMLTLQRQNDGKIEVPGWVR